MKHYVLICRPTVNKIALKEFNVLVHIIPAPWARGLLRPKNACFSKMYLSKYLLQLALALGDCAGRRLLLRA